MSRITIEYTSGKKETFEVDRSYKDVDTLVFQRPVAFGLIGLIPSVVLLYLAIRNLTM